MGRRLGLDVVLGLGWDFLPAGWEPQADAGASAGFTVNGQGAPMRLHGGEGHGQTQPRAFAWLLGGVEGVHGLLQHFPGHPHPVILHLHLNPVLVPIPGTQGEGAFLGHGVHSIDAEIHEGVRQGVGVAADEVQLWVQLQLQADLRQGGPRQQPRLLLEQGVQIDLVVFGRALAGKAQEPLDHLATPLGGLADGVEGLVKRAALRLGAEVGRSQPENGPEHVVHVVRHPAGQGSKALQLLRLLKLNLESGLLRFRKLALAEHLREPDAAVAQV